jgi:hypothetical protein
MPEQVSIAPSLSGTQPSDIYSIPNTRQACFDCGDFEHEHVQVRYEMAILFEDEEKSTLQVAIHDEVIYFASDAAL